MASTEWRTKPATERQISWALRLGEITGVEVTIPEGMTAGQASDLIDSLKAKPRIDQPKAADPEVEIELGFYEANDRIYEIKRSQRGRIYGVVLTKDEGWTCEAGDYGRTELAAVINSGKIKLRAETAAFWGHERSKCVFCSRTLKDDRSLSLGFGPECARQHGMDWGHEHLVRVA